MAPLCPHCGLPEGAEHLCGVSHTALLGQVLDGRYRIESVLGQGGMGTVFRAIQTSVHRPVAIKTLAPSLAATPLFFERFRREAEVASRLRHPNVVTIFDFGRAQDGTCYFVMELLQGESLRDLVKREGPLSLRRAVNIIEQASRGLAHAHEQGCVHRDLKPHNIMVQQLDGRDFVKVLDFGLVKALEHENEQQLTSSGQVLGTPQYMSPEQAAGEGVDQRSDLYSMAAVFYFCLTGSPPYGANTVRRALTAILTQPVPTVASRRQGAPVPQALEDVLQKALAPESEDRYQNAEELVDAMWAAVANLPPEELDARPTGGGDHEGGGASKSGERSHSPLERSSPNALRARTPVVQAPAAGARGDGMTSSSNRLRTLSPETMTVPPSPGEGWSTATKVALGVVPLLLLAAGGAHILTLRHSTPPSPLVEVAAPKQETPAPPAPTSVVQPAPDDRVLVRFHSSPAGVAIFDGDVQIGATPSELRLRRDKVHVLTFRLAEHETITRTLDFSRVTDDTQVVAVTLKPVPPASAVRSRPSRSSKPPQQRPDDIVIFE